MDPLSLFTLDMSFLKVSAPTYFGRVYLGNWATDAPAAWGHQLWLHSHVEGGVRVWLLDTKNKSLVPFLLLIGRWVKVHDNEAAALV